MTEEVPDQMPAFSSSCDSTVSATSSNPSRGTKLPVKLNFQRKPRYPKRSKMLRNASNKIQKLEAKVRDVTRVTILGVSAILLNEEQNDERKTTDASLIYPQHGC